MARLHDAVREVARTSRSRTVVPRRAGARRHPRGARRPWGEV